CSAFSFLSNRCLFLLHFSHMSDSKLSHHFPPSGKWTHHSFLPSKHMHFPPSSGIIITCIFLSLFAFPKYDKYFPFGEIVSNAWLVPASPQRRRSFVVRSIL